MRTGRAQTLVGAILVASGVAIPAFAADPLSSWNDTAPKKAAAAFVERVTKEGSPAERIAVFDNGGTLWTEQPMYFQAALTFDRVKALAPKHPELKEKEPFASVLRGDFKSALAGGDHALLDMVMATHAGMTTEDFSATVTKWIARARHPKT